MIPVFEPVIEEDDIQAVVSALKDGEISGTFGQNIKDFETEFADSVKSAMEDRRNRTDPAERDTWGEIAEQHLAFWLSLTFPSESAAVEPGDVLSSVKVTGSVARPFDLATADCSEIKVGGGSGWWPGFWPGGWRGSYLRGAITFCQAPPGWPAP